MVRKGLGWVPDYPDVRDYRLENEKIQLLNGECDPLADHIAHLKGVVSKIAPLLASNPSLQQDIETSTQAIQIGSTQKIKFQNASFDGSVLAYGCQGKAVHALKEKLKILGCHHSKDATCSDPEQVFYDRSLEAAVRKFQQQQKLPQTGIASSVTLAKIAALSAIASQAQSPLYLSSGDIGPGVIYLQQKLLTLQQRGKLQVDPINPEELRGGIFGETTYNAVVAFQQTVFAAKVDWDGIVGPKTSVKLQEHFQSRLTELLRAPIAPIHFEVIKAAFLDILPEEPPQEHGDTFDPLIDVMAQLLPFLHGYDDQEICTLLENPNQTTIAQTELHQALTAAYDLLKDYRLKKSSETPLFVRLERAANQLRSRRGYFSSRALDTFTYAARGDKNIDQGAAIIYIQERLSNLGFYKAPITGYFEELTEAAVKEFQTKFKLDANGEVETSTKEKLRALDEEQVRLLQAPIPDNFLQGDKQAIDLSKDEQSKLQRLLMQMMIPIAKHLDLKVAIQDCLITAQAIAQYSLIRQTAAEFWKPPEDYDRQLKRWWKLFQTETESEQSQRLLEVHRDRELLDRFESAIVDFVHHLPKASKIVQILYQSLSEDLKDLQMLDSPSNLIAPLIDNIQKIQTNPESLELIAPKQPRKPTFIRIDQILGGNLYAAIQGCEGQLDQNFCHGSIYYELPEAVDLSFWCSPIEDQGKLNACTAHAGVGLVEYFERRSFGQYLNASRLFLYKAARNLMQREGDSGASVRETMKALVLFGVPPEEYHPYDETNFDAEPAAFCYAYAQNYQAIRYFRLDDSQLQPVELLAQIKLTLVSGFPCIFGFTAYDSIEHPATPRGHIPFPTQENKREGGHSVVAVGYDDYKQIKNAPQPGAILIRNSWGTSWGDRGYGWLPYDYVLNGLARDWWSLIKAEWVETGSFGLGASFSWSAITGTGSGKGNDTTFP